MPNFVPLHCHSHYSLLDGLSKPKDIARRCVQLGHTACAITDHGSISGAVQFMKAMKGVCGNCGRQKDDHDDGRCPHAITTYSAAKLKPILGCEFYINNDKPEEDKNREKNSHLVVLAKNLQGWKQLIQASSFANDPENYKRKPRLTLDQLSQFTDGSLVAFSGHIGSDLANVLFSNYGLTYNARTTEEAAKYVHPDAISRATELAERYRDIFGKENFFIEIQLVDAVNMPVAYLIADMLREVSQDTGIPCVATPDAHYAAPEDAFDQRVLLCTNMDTTFAAVKEKMDRGQDVPLSSFYRSRNYHIPSAEEILKLNTEEEVANTLLIESMCEVYDLTSPPRLPKFPIPDPNLSPDEYLIQLCRDGWHEHLPKIEDVVRRMPHYNLQTYADRVRREIGVLKEANLSDYFLIVHDFTKAARERGELIGPGRGSAAGSLVLYLLGVTQIDPIEYDLLFERFYNAGRNKPGHVSLPDVDMDFEITSRQKNLDYCRNKYGHDHVAQMLTFSRMQGRGALKDVLRAHAACDFNEMNRITKSIPDEAEISGELQEMDEPSIILWTLENEPEGLKEYAYLDDSGKVQGKFSRLFEQAIRLEGTKRSQGKHAAGMVISPIPLSEVCPMVYDKKSKEKIAGMEMGDLEEIGIPKFDMLGVAVLDKLHMVQNQVETGDLGYDEE